MREGDIIIEVSVSFECDEYDIDEININVKNKGYNKDIEIYEEENSYNNIKYSYNSIDY